MMSYCFSQYVRQEHAYSRWLWNILLALIISFTGTSAIITVSPKNTAALKGQQVTLSCSTSLRYTLEWKVKEVSHPTPISIYDGYEINPEFTQYYSINKSVSGQYDIVVKKTDRAIATLHQCIESADGVQTTRSAELIILETRPQCKQYFDIWNAEDVTMLCHVNYSGNWPPTMKWTSNGNDYPANSETIRNELRSKLTIPINNIIKGQNFTCTTKFASEVYNGTATERNVPNYVQDCLVKPVKNQISESTCYILTILDDSDNKNMILRCLANYSGSLNPVIEWIGNNEKFTNRAQTELIPDTRITSTLKLPLKDLKDEQKLICQAKFEGCGRECTHECTVIVPNGVNEISKEFLKQHTCTCTALVVLVVVLVLILTAVSGVAIFKSGYIQRTICLKN